MTWILRWPQNLLLVVAAAAALAVLAWRNRNETYYSEDE